jgi:hypothetical protein
VFDSAVWTLFYRQKNLPLVPPEVPVVPKKKRNK